MFRDERIIEGIEVENRSDWLTVGGMTTADYANQETRSYHVRACDACVRLYVTGSRSLHEPVFPGPRMYTLPHW